MFVGSRVLGFGEVGFRVRGLGMQGIWVACGFGGFRDLGFRLGLGAAYVGLK